jgi:cytochrome P450
VSSDSDITRSDDVAGGDPDPTELPLPPYPESLGPHQLHILHQVRDRLAFTEQAMEHHDVYRLHVLGKEFYALGHPDHMERVLLTDRSKFEKTDDNLVAFGEGLLATEGDLWQRQADALQPLFRRDSVLDYADGMVEQVRRRLDTWEDGQTFELQREFTDMTLDVIFATLLGRELALDGDQRIREASERLHDWFVPTSYFLPEWVPTPARRRFRKGKQTLEDEAQRLLDEAAGNVPDDPTEADDLISLLMGLHEAGIAGDAGMATDQRLRDQMVTIIFAGHDTTTTTLTFACWALANNPEVEERFHEEVDALDGPPTMADLEDLTVTDNLVTETLRMYPPVYSLPRVATEDVAFDGYRVPEGETVTIPVRAIQRDGRFYDDPETFRPSRWDGDLRKELHNFAYAPFSGGPRICIGREFALMEAKLTLATIGREYDLYWLGENTDEGEPPTSPEMTLRMSPGQEFLASER